MKQALLNHLKNIYGWKTKRKIVVISVDDYGNVRLDSKQARGRMDKAGLKIHSRFDAVDALETKEDLEMLYEVLSSVKDKNGNSAIFTPFALPCNINFEKIIEEGFQQYHYELLPETYRKLEAKDPDAYSGAWKLWQEGIKNNLMHPEFHGREHLNLKIFEEKLQKKDKEVVTALKNRSYTSLSGSGYSTIGYTAAFQFWEMKENDRLKEIIPDGLKRFEEVYSYPATQFNAPGGQEHRILHKVLKENGISYVDSPILRKEHQGEGKFKTSYNQTGKKNEAGMYYQVRNVVFEPTSNRDMDWVNYSFQQVEAAFRLSKPAIISSHRANFGGHIDPANRKKGLGDLEQLLKKIVQHWPEVEFMAAPELGDLISKKV